MSKEPRAMICRYRSLALPWASCVLCAFSSYAAIAGPAITLKGSPEQIGTTWGALNAASINSDMQKSFFDLAAQQGLSQETLLHRGRRFVEICQTLAPHWLEEADAIAAAAQVDKDLYTCYMGSVYRALFLGDECTSYTVARQYTQDNAIFFHKTRDSADKPQAFCAVTSTVPGVAKFLTITDTAVLSSMMMVNEHGLAGSADMGGMKPGKPRFRGMMNTFILRYIAERAHSCQEALHIIEGFVRKGDYAGGHKTGTHWLFVDKTGAILEVTNNAWEVQHAYHNEKVYFSVRGDTNAAVRLRDNAGPIDFTTFHNVSRDPSMCFESSRAGLTVEIDPDYPQFLTRAWATLPAKGMAFPLYMGCESTPRPLADGEVYALSKDIDGQTASWESMEESLYGNHCLAEQAARDWLEQGRPAEAISLLDGWIEKTVGAQVSMLRLLKASAGARGASVAR